jgi:hypothetical protein
VKEVCSIIITTRKAKYANLARKLEITKGLIQSAVDKEISFHIPMMKEPKDDDNEAYAVLSYAGPENKKIHLKALSCSDSELEVKSKGDV